MTRLLLTYLVISVAKGEQVARPPIETPPMIKIISTKPYVFFSFLKHFCVQQYIRLKQTNINIDDQVAWAPSNQNLTIQFKCITREKFKVFVLKVITSGPHLIICKLHAIT